MTIGDTPMLFTVELIPSTVQTSNMNTGREYTLRELEGIYDLTKTQLSEWRNDGIDIQDAKAVVLKMSSLTRRPVKWRPIFDKILGAVDEGSHEHWKKKKTEEEVRKLELSNSKAAGEMFDRADGEKIQQAAAAALATLLAERRGTLPQVLAGKDEAWISKHMDESDHQLLTDLSNLESSAWTQAFEKYASTERTPATENKSTGAKATRPTQRKRVVRKER